jgi:hypothetical protein
MHLSKAGVGGPAGQVTLSWVQAFFPQPHPRTPQAPRVRTRAGQGSPGPRVRGQPGNPETDAQVRSQASPHPHGPAVPWPGSTPVAGRTRAGAPAGRAGTRRCPWCCPRRAGRGRGGGGARAPANGGGSARGAGGGGQSAGRTRLRAALGVYGRAAGGWGFGSAPAAAAAPPAPLSSDSGPSAFCAAHPGTGSDLSTGPADHAPGAPRKPDWAESRQRRDFRAGAPPGRPALSPRPGAV